MHAQRQPGPIARPAWHGWLITLLIVLIGCTGVLALWGDTIAGWFDSDDSKAPQKTAPAPAKDVL